MKFISFICIAAVFLIGRPVNLSADELLLANGQVLKGRIIKKTPGEIWLEVCGGTIAVKRDQISSIEAVSLKENYLFLADEYKAVNNGLQARRYYNLALTVDPACPKAERGLARLKKSENLVQDLAEKKEKQILELNELALQESGRENYSKSLDYLQKARRLDKKNKLTRENLVQVYLNYSWQLFRSGKKSAAIKLLYEAEKLLPENMELPVLLGEFYLRDDNLDKAIDIWEEALRKLPGSPHLQSRLESVYRLKSGKPLDIYYSDNLFRFKPSGNLNAESKALLDRIIDIFAAVGGDLGSSLYYYPPKISTVIVYANDSIAPVISSGMIFNDREIVVSLPVFKNAPPGKIESRVIYASTCLFLHSLMGDNSPGWLKEGYALYRSGVSFDDRILKDALAGKTFYKLRKVNDFLRNKRSGERQKMVEAECLSFVSFLIDNFGERFLFDTFKEIAQGTDYEDAFETFFAWDIYQLEKQWVDSLGG
ncbi:MAG: hypothetical protein U9Q24_04245 [Candidatus Ratteibacteria bacterium]|nr:hypothetical protein [Candidatus Ratteibacteria bacterium]